METQQGRRKGSSIEQKIGLYLTRPHTLCLDHFIVDTAHCRH